MQTRFSRTAIVGAGFIVFAVMLLGCSWFVAGLSESGFTEIYDNMTLLELASKGLAAMGALCLLVSTIIGWMAVWQIRRSAGKLHGLWLAVLDGLLLPLLVADVAVFALVFLIVTLLSKLPYFSASGASGFGGELAIGYQIAMLFFLWLGSGTLCSLVADFLIIRRVWRAVNKGGAAAAASNAARRARTRPEPRFSKAKMAIAIGVAVVLAAGTVTVVVKATFFPAPPDSYFLPNYTHFQRLPSGLFILRPTHFSTPVNGLDYSCETDSPSGDHVTWNMGRNRSFLQLLCRIYNCDINQVVLPPGAPTERFDYLYTLRDPNGLGHFEAAIRKLGYIAHWEDQPVRMLVVQKVADSTPSSQNPAAGGNVSTTIASNGNPTLSYQWYMDPNSPGDDGTREQANSPFVARLPQGSVELLAVATAGRIFPDTNRVRTWRPDGILTTNFNFRPAGNSSLSDVGDTNVIYREVILQSKGLPAGDADMQCEASDPGTQSDWPEAWLNGRPATNIFIGNLQLPVEAKTLHLKIGVAAGPWTRDDLLCIPQSDVGSSDNLFDQGRTNWMACIQSIEEKNGSTKVIAYHTAVAGWQAQLLLVDFAGKEWPLGNGFTLGGLCSISAECRGLKLSQVKEIHFRIRPYHTVEFSNVSLEPGYRTAVTVKDSDEESHAGTRPESAK
jgi:hypothetical protein